MPYIRCKLNIIVTFRHYRYTWTVWMKNIRYWGNKALPWWLKKEAKWGQNANYRQFHYDNAIYSRQVEQNRYISSLQIYLDSVKWKIFVTGVTKNYQVVKKEAKWGQNANYRQFHYGNAIYSLQVEQNRYISSLQIYLDSVKWKIFVTGVTKHFQVG